jgi:chromosome segregation ATPase
MRPQAFDDLRTAIEQNTERRSLEELKAEGKKHVRVVSGEKVMRIIRAIVDDIVDREVGELNSQDRDRIVHETKAQFDRVLKMQTDQDTVIREQKAIIDEHKQQLESLRAERQQLARERDDARREDQTTQQNIARLEERLDRSKTTIENYEREFRVRTEEAEDLKRRVAGQEQQIALLGSQLEDARATDQNRGALEERLGEAKATIESCNAEIHRLTERIRDDDALLGELKEALQAKEIEAERLTERVGALQGQIDQARQDAGESSAVSDLRSELAEMKSVLLGMDQRQPEADEATLSALMEKLAEREAATSREFDGKFEQSLDKALDQITRTMEAATARPIDVRVEATDVLVDKLFDSDDDDLKSNLEHLEVEVKKSKAGIAGNLARLKALRTAPGPEE